MRLLAGTPRNQPRNIAVRTRRHIGQGGHLNVGVVVEHLLVIFQTHKGQTTRKHAVHHHTERKNISLRADLHLWIQDLRRNVGGGAHGCARIHLIVTAGKTKVRELHLTVSVEKNIARLNIAVQVAVRVHLRERLHHRNENIQSLTQGQGITHTQQLAQGATVHILQDDVHDHLARKIFGTRRNHTHRMPAAAHLAHRTLLTVEFLAVRRILRQGGGEDLERDRVIRPQVQRIIDLAHAAAANERTHLVMTLNNGATEPLRRTDSGIRGSGASGGRNRSICRRTRGHRRNPAWAGSIHTSQHFSPPTWAEAMPKGAEQVNTQRILKKHGQV